MEISITAMDDINVDIKPAVKVFCIKCNGHVFWLNRINKDKPLYPIDFIKIKGIDVANMICPFCSALIAAFDGNKPKFKTSEGWK